MSSHPNPDERNEVEWLGDLPFRWSVGPLKRQLLRNDGGVWGDDPELETGTPVIRSTEQTAEGHWAITNPATRQLSAREISIFALKSGDLLITKSSGSAAHIGKATLVTKPIEEMGAAYSNFMQRIRVSVTNVPRFFWYVMRSNEIREQINLNSTTTTGLSNLTGTVIGNLVVPILPAAEQQTIADFLDHETAEIDEFIADQEELIALLGERRTATITHAVTKGLKPDEPTKDSGVEWLGEVPEHWEVRPSKSVFALRNERERPGDVHLTPSQIHGVMPQYQYMAVTGNRVVLALAGTTMKHVTKDDFVIHLRSFQGGIEWSNYSGRVSPAYTVLRPRAGVIPAFFRYCLKSRGYIERIASLTDQLRDGQSMRYYDFGKTPLPLPPIDEQKAIASFIDHEIAEIDAVIVEAREAIALSKERRAAVISAAVTGKIDVRGAIVPTTKNVEAESVGAA